MCVYDAIVSYQCTIAIEILLTYISTMDIISIGDIGYYYMFKCTKY